MITPVLLKLKIWKIVFTLNYGQFSKEQERQRKFCCLQNSIGNCSWSFIGETGRRARKRQKNTKAIIAVVSFWNPGTL